MCDVISELTRLFLLFFYVQYGPIRDIKLFSEKHLLILDFLNTELSQTNPATNSEQSLFVARNN